MKNNEHAPLVVKHFSLRDRRLWLLIALAAATVYVVATQWFGGPAPARPAPAARSPQVQKNQPRTASETELEATRRAATSSRTLDVFNTADPSLMPKLEVSPKPFEQEKRNLFAFFIPPPPPPPEPVCGDKACNGRENYQSCPEDCPPPPPPPPPPVCGDKRCEGNEDYMNCPEDCSPPPPPEITLKYIGYLSDQEGPVAFLTDSKDVYMGRVNDIIANRYKVIRITEDGVELGYVSLKTGQSRTIPFQGNK